VSRSTLETIRRIRLGNVQRLLRHRYGLELPDDDAGRDDLEILFCMTSDTRHVFAAEIWAPWMQPTEVAEISDRVKRLPPKLRWLPSEVLGQRLRVTNAQRDALKLWQIAACDVTAEERLELRKAKERARSQARRRKRNSISRAAYLAKSLSRAKPWLDEGISRRAWYRRKARADTSPSADQKRDGTSPTAINSSLLRSHLCHLPKGQQRAPEARLRTTVKIVQNPPR
jgi:hypothetical protein